jgi:PhoPQ-activated pathogenicity-related protein
MGLHGACMADGTLLEYVKKPDAAFSWQLISAADGPQGNVYSLELTSQNWRGITWKHALFVIKPASVVRPDHALLYITGGSNPVGRIDADSGEVRILSQVAQAIGAVVAIVCQVPNQPLYNGLSEDALIAYTFDQYMNTMDTTWPLLLPMVKSAVKAMDATQAFAREHLGIGINHFVVTGGSKRGWTTWLTGAVDPRVRAIAPMVIDVLNMAEQMPHQLEVWGAYSDEIGDYTRLNIQERMATPPGEKLRSIVDPFSYRDRLTMPKLILIGTNDPYWPVDAVNLYFNQLKGQKFILYIPNAGHDLGSGREAIAGIVGFFTQVASGTPLPEFSWTAKREENRAVLTVNAKTKPVEVNLWSAHSPIRDFKQATWQKIPVAVGSNGNYVTGVGIPQAGYVAFYGELVYPIVAGQTYYLCTNMHVFGQQ